MRVFLLTAFAMAAFASNSLLTRGALGGDRLDAASFTFVRLATGMLALTLLTRVRAHAQPLSASDRGSWVAALALAGYAVFFTVAYTRIGASVGALLLFGSVQITMIGVGLTRGERPPRIDWAGLVLAFTGLVVLTLPGAAAPDAFGATLMIAAGACWGGYSIAGRSSRDPLGATAGNFIRAAACGALFVAVLFRGIHLTPSGIWLATASGALASGVGYTAWYAVLPALPAWRAAVVQLVVPVLTALAAAALLGEHVTTRLILATGCIAAGVWLTVAPGWHRS